jgi:hypothetical protein
MGFTHNLGTLAQGVFSDSSLNIGIGAAPSGSYKFETTGTAKISSTLLVSGVTTFGSTLSNGTYSYTLPSATGTLALTSDIPSVSGYVPYTGATQSVDLGTFDLTSRYLVAAGAPALGGVISMRQDAAYLPKGNGYSSIASSGVLFDFYGYTGVSTYKNFSFRFDSLTNNTNRTYTLPDATGTLALVGGAGVGTVTSVAALTLGTSGTDLSSTVANGTTTPVITLNVPDASATNRGVVTTGTQTFAGAKTLTGNLSLTSAATGGVIITNNNNSHINLFRSISPTANFGININGNGDLNIDETGVATRVTITKTTGAATFSSTIKSSDTYGFTIGSVASTRRIQYGSDAATSFTLLTDANGYAGLYAGAATFSSSVNVNGATNNASYALLVNGNVASITSAGTNTVYLSAGSTKSYIATSYVGAGSYVPLAFEVGGSERLTITTGGNVGIGTQSPGYDGAGYGAIRYLTQYGAGGTSHELAASSTATDAFIGSLDFINTSNAGTGGSGRYGIASIRGFTTNAGATNTGGGYLAFVTKADGGSGAERMRITSVGNVLINTTTDNGYQTQIIDAGYGLYIAAGSTSSHFPVSIESSSFASLFRVRGDALVSFPQINNFTTGNSPNTWINPASSYGIYINTSSLRYKKDISNYDKGIDIVNQLRPVYYKGISEVDGDKQFVGLIAEEIHDLGLTEFVNYNEEGLPNSLSYPNMIALAFKAIQELSEKIKTLENK